MQTSPSVQTSLALALLAAACGGEPSASTVGSAADDPFCAQVAPRVEAFLSGFPQPAGDRFGGTAVTASYGEFQEGMNSLVSADYTTRQHQNFVNMMTLVQYDADLEPVPYLAESWELSDDGTQLTFHLRDDVFWHDGEPTTAHDVAFTYIRATDPETGFFNPGYWAHYTPGPEGVEVVDDFTVRIGLSRHVDPLDAWRATAIMPRHLLEDVPATELRGHPFNDRCPVGNGPFVFVEHRPDESWTYARNPAFPEGLGGPPYLDRLVYRVILEQTTLLTELLTEGIDVYSALNPDQADDVLAAEHLDLLAFPFRQVNFVAWNGRRPQLADPRVRTALTLATDRQQIVEALVQGYGDVANTLVPPFHWAFMPEMEGELAYDPDRARQLLDEAGWTDRDGDGVRENADGVPLALTLKTNQGNQVRADMAELIQAQVGQVGVDVEVQVVEWNTMVTQLTEDRDFDGAMFGWVSDFRIDDADLFHSERTEGAMALSGTQNPRIDQFLDTLQLILDRDEAIPHWHEYQRTVLEEQPYLILYFSQRLDGVNRRVQDVEMDVRGEWLTARQWWIPSDRRKYGSVADR